MLQRCIDYPPATGQLNWSRDWSEEKSFVFETCFGILKEISIDDVTKENFEVRLKNDESFGHVSVRIVEVASFHRKFFVGTGFFLFEMLTFGENSNKDFCFENESTNLGGDSLIEFDAHFWVNSRVRSQMSEQISGRQTKASNVFFDSSQIVLNVVRNRTNDRRWFEAREFVTSFEQKAKSIELKSTNCVLDKFIGKIRCFVRPNFEELFTVFFGRISIFHSEIGRFWFDFHVSFSFVRSREKRRLSSSDSNFLVFISKWKEIFFLVRVRRASKINLRRMDNIFSLRVRERFSIGSNEFLVGSEIRRFLWAFWNKFSAKGRFEILVDSPFHDVDRRTADSDSSISCDRSRFDEDRPNS